MSDSDLSEASVTPTPPDRELEESLRRAVTKAQRAGDDFSYNSIRAASETQLGLKPGFYKAHPQWTQHSKHIINDQMNTSEQDHTSPPKPTRPPPRETISRPPKRAAEEKQPQRRKKPKAKQSAGDDSSSELSSPPRDVESQAPKEKPVKKLRQTTADSAAANGVDKDIRAPAPVLDESESEMSVVLDEEPPAKAKKRQFQKAGSVERTKKAKSGKGPADADLDPDQAEIKRLQGWLVRCGIRKLWGKELKPYETARAKIKHLRDMLADVGMTGRYSIDKATQIREARELAADIEAVQEGAERWGADDEDGGRHEPADQARPARRLVRGAKHYDFLSSDGEETD